MEFHEKPTDKSFQKATINETSQVNESAKKDLKAVDKMLEKLSEHGMKYEGSISPGKTGSLSAPSQSFGTSQNKGVSM